MNPAALVDEVVNPPPEVKNQNNEVGVQVNLDNNHDGIDLLANAAVMNNNDPVGIDAEMEAVNDNMEIVIGLAAVPGANVEEMEDNAVQNDAVQNVF